MHELYAFNAHILTSCYRGDARRSWWQDAALRERLLSSFASRVLARGLIETYACGMAARAAAEARDPAERASLRREALRLAGRGLHSPQKSVSPPAAALIACLRGDRAAAIAALRAHLAIATPWFAGIVKRKLAELIGGE